MRKIRLTANCGVLLAAISLLTANPAFAAEPTEATKQKERELIAILQSDRPAAEKAVPCKLLAVYGSADAVPALAPLLTDEQLASWARIALEAIPGPEADKALRDAAGKLDGRLLVGTINSIGVRGDKDAVQLLSGKMKSSDADVASAAAVALGKIGTPPAAELLRNALAGSSAEVRSAVAEGCILCAERYLADGKADAARTIYDQVRAADIPKQRIAEATRGAILARGGDGVVLLVEQLKSDDRDMVRIALSAARELQGPDVADGLAAALTGLGPERGGLLVYALADRDDATVTPALLHSVESGPKQIRLAALGLVGRAGDASSVQAILEVALDKDAEIAAAAKSALAGLPGKDVNAAITARLPEADGDKLVLLLELVGKRRINTEGALMKAIDHPNAQIRRAALAALGETARPSELSVLIEQVAKSTDGDDAAAARKALRAAAVRMPDREATAAQLAGAMTDASLSMKNAYLETLGAMGGAKSLATLGAAAKSGPPELQDTSTRLLGTWMSTDAAPVLLDLAKTLPEDKYKIRALRGYIRLMRQFTMPDDERADMARQALAAADRAAEQQLVLEVADRYPNLPMLKAVVEAAKKPELTDGASRVAVAIATKLGGESGAHELLAQIGQEPVELEILEATYGAGDKQKDVTPLVRRQAGKLRLISLPSPSYNAAFGGDPSPGIVKQLTIRYRIDGREGSATFPENATIMLPTLKSQ